MIVEHNCTLRDVLKKLESRNIKLLFVIMNNKLVGSITDGDIRRAIVNGHNINEELSAFMNNEPIYARENDSLEHKISLFNKDILLLPIVDKKNSIMRILSISELKSLPNLVFLMAGGMGSRLGKLTEKTPKPFLKIGNRPILELIIDQFKQSKITEFFISVNHQAEKIKNYFQDGKHLSVDIKYIQENKLYGYQP